VIMVILIYGLGCVLILLVNQHKTMHR